MFDKEWKELHNECTDLRAEPSLKRCCFFYLCYFLNAYTSAKTNPALIKSIIIEQCVGVLSSSARIRT